MATTNIELRRWLEQFPDDAVIQVMMEVSSGYSCYAAPTDLDLTMSEAFGDIYGDHSSVDCIRLLGDY